MTTPDVAPPRRTRRSAGPVPVDGGFRFTGRWPYSTGTDHAGWVILGGMVADADGKRRDARPTCATSCSLAATTRSSRTRWNVMGLGGTGSKDVRMTDVFVPELPGPRRRPRARQHLQRPVAAGLPALRHALRRDVPLRHLGRHLRRSPAAPCAAGNTSRPGSPRRGAPPRPTRSCSRPWPAPKPTWRRASPRPVDRRRFHDTVAGGGDITVKERLRFRVDQVRATDRAIEAVNELYRLMGSSSIQKGSPLERYWRDLQVASTHVCNSREPCLPGLGAGRVRRRDPAVRPVLTSALGSLRLHRLLERSSHSTETHPLRDRA